MPDYIDTSAAAKLVVTEAETDALRTYLLSQPAPPVASDLTRTELLRATRRSAALHTTTARAVLDTFTLLTVSTQLFEQAALLDPPELRTLDAIHLACALSLGDDLEYLISYDHRLADAAASLGLRVLSPA